ncbi:MAG: tetratricopeptide repeat protein [Rhizobacter sp.]|nr:tetratricopeptide repeat protein [Chlorobiales bacterium]
MAQTVDLDKFSRTLASAVKLREAKDRYVSIFSLDIVGFTTMSEKLGDPEAVKNVIAACFTSFTDVVKRYGAYVDRYQGDAMTAIFGLGSDTEDGDCESNVMAALEVLDQFNPINEELAKRGVEIAARIGIHVGHVDIAPDQKGNLTATGDVPIFAERFQAFAPRLGLCVSKEVLEKLPQGKFRLGETIPVKVKDGLELPGTAIEDFANDDVRKPYHPFNETQFRNQLTATAQLKEGERRVVTVFFMELGAEHSNGDKLSADLYAAVADAVFELSTDVVKKYNAYIDKYQGNSMMVLFGVEASEADCERAILSAMEIIENVPAMNAMLKEYDVKASVRMGINVGEVTIAPDQKGNVTAMGDVVNTAARLEVNAHHDSFLVSNEVRLQAGGNYSYSEPMLLALKGKAEKFEAYEVTGINTKREERWEREKASRKDAVYIGREEELSNLEQIYSRFKQSQGKMKFISITGPAGYGKSRIIYEFLRRNGEKVSSGIFLKGHTLSFSQPPYAMFSTMLKRYFKVEGERNKETIKKIFEERYESLYGQTSVDLSIYKPIIGNLVGAEYDDERLRTTDFNAFKTDVNVALRQFLTALAEYSNKKLKRILFIQFEDMHWIDDVSEEALIFLAENLTTKYPVLIFGLHRLDYTMPARVQQGADYSRVDLKPFTRQETEQLVRAIVNLAFPADVLDEIFKKSEGNPFYIEELIESMQAQGVIAEKDGRLAFVRVENFQLPATINALVITRYDLLAKPAKDFLACGAVMGKEFVRNLAVSVEQKVTEEAGSSFARIAAGEIPVIVREASEKGFIYEKQDILGFKHTAMQEAVYSSLLRDNRKTLHKAVAEAIEQNFGQDLYDYSFDLYYHHRKAEQEQAALKYGVLAVGRANKLFDFRSVRDVSEDLLALTKDKAELEPTRFETLKNFEKVLLLQGPKEQHTAVVDELLAIAERRNDKRMIAEAKNVKGWQLVTVSALEQADGIGREVLVLNEELNDPQIEIKACENIASANFYAQNWDDVKIFFQRMYDRAKEIGDLVSEAKGLRGVGVALSWTGQQEQAATVYKDVLAITDRSGDKLFRLKVLTNLGQIYIQNTLYKEAYEVYMQLYELAELIGDRSQLSSAINNLADIYITIGDFKSAETLYTNLINENKVSEENRTRFFVYFRFFGVLLELKRFDEARLYLEKAHAIATATNDPTLWPYYYNGICDFLIDQNRYLEALPYVQTYLDNMSDDDPADFYFLIGVLVRKMICLQNTDDAMAMMPRLEKLLVKLTTKFDMQAFYFRIFKSIHRKDEKKAEMYLNLARKALLETSKNFGDPKFKKGFLSKPENKEISETYKTWREKRKAGRESKQPKHESKKKYAKV